MSASQKRPLSPADDFSDGVDVFSSAPILDRSSTFVAHFHPLTDLQTSTTKQAPLTSTVKACQSHPDFASADHRMVAWRRPSAQRTLGLGPGTTSVAAPKPVYAVGSDDDGEKYAGKRLERVLIDLDVEGIVVVARWYGGILLGPVRFTHIEMVAREAVRKWKSRQEGQAKRQKMASPATPSTGSTPEVVDEAQRAKLAKQLVERDNSIVVLRGLLAEKTTKARQESGENSSQVTPTPTQSSVSPAKKIDYSEMPLQRLRQLDKARDATIAFILKQIDMAEEEEKKREENTKEGTAEEESKEDQTTKTDTAEAEVDKP